MVWSEENQGKERSDLHFIDYWIIVNILVKGEESLAG